MSFSFLHPMFIVLVLFLAVRDTRLFSPSAILCRRSRVPVAVWANGELALEFDGESI